MFGKLQINTCGLIAKFMFSKTSPNLFVRLCYRKLKNLKTILHASFNLFLTCSEVSLRIIAINYTENPRLIIKNSYNM